MGEFGFGDTGFNIADTDIGAAEIDAEAVGDGADGEFCGAVDGTARAI